MIKNLIYNFNLDENGKGVYQLNSTSGDDYPVYYYRGDVTNNNVKFANFCWKIVRTTETGGVKLIYSGEPNKNGGCTNVGEATQLTETKFNSGSSFSPAYVGYMYGELYERQTKTMTDIDANYMYGNSVSYSKGVYTLETTKVGRWSELWNGGLSYNHYTCFSESSTCSTVYYIYHVDSSSVYYIELNNGKNFKDALEEMFSNKYNSTIKEYIDSWYRDNMIEYANFLEDTVWCNDRSIGDYGSWKPDGGDPAWAQVAQGYLQFNGRVKVYKGPDLKCLNLKDKFTVYEANGNGDLNYPIGLLTFDEIMYAGSFLWKDDNNYLDGGFWTMSPVYFSYNSSYLFSYSINQLLSYTSADSCGVRPSVSLKVGTKIFSGDGSYDRPFEIFFN